VKPRAAAVLALVLFVVGWVALSIVNQGAWASPSSIGGTGSA